MGIFGVFWEFEMRNWHWGLFIVASNIFFFYISGEINYSHFTPNLVRLLFNPIVTQVTDNY